MVANSKVKTGWRCEKGHEWQARYGHIKHGAGCPVCAGNSRKVPRDYHALATERGFVWLGPKVQNNGAKTKWRCSKGHEWWAIYSNIQRGKGCPVCANCAPRTPGDYHSLAAERGFQWLGPKVTSVGTKTKWRCSEGHEWWTKYGHIQQGSGCPTCNESRGEAVVASALDALSIDYRRQVRLRGCRNERLLPFDFSFTFRGLSFLIEYDGQQHFEPVGHFGGDEALETRQLHDQIKNEFAAKHGFALIRIPYTVENIQTYLIQAIADACGIEFGDVLATAKQEETAVRAQPANVHPATGIQIPLI